MAFSPQIFLSNIYAKDGLARTNRFEVILPIPDYIGKFVSQSVIEQIINLPNNIIADVSGFLQGGNGLVQSANPSITQYLALQCESAELPGKMLMTTDAKVYGPTFKIPHGVQYQDINLTFICTNEFYERKLFDRWLEAIMPSDTNNLRFPKGKQTRYMTTMTIVQYDDFVSKIYGVNLIDAFPIGIASQPLNWGDDQFHRVSVQFAYQRYQTIYEGSTDIVSASVQLFGAQASKWWTNSTNKALQPLGRFYNSVINSII